MPGHLPQPVPLAALAPLDRMMLEIKAPRDLADEGGLGTLADRLDMALIEARHQAEQRRRDAVEHEAEPGALWRFEP